MLNVRKSLHPPKQVTILFILTVLCLPFTAIAGPTDQRDVIVIMNGEVAKQSDRQGNSKQQALARHIDNRARAANLAADHGVSARHTYGTVLKGFSARINEQQLAKLKQDPRVARIEKDGTAWVSRGKPDRPPKPEPTQETPWGIERIGSGANKGQGVHVYVIDSGIDSDHPDLVGNIDHTRGWSGYPCKGKRCNYDWDDDNGHGTHVAGTIGAIDNQIGVIGVAPEVTLHAIKVLHKSGSGAWSVIAAGVDWAAMDMTFHGAPAVANMSLGGYDTKTGICSAAGFTGTGVLHEAICRAKNLGMVIVVAAGNSGADSADEIPAAFDDSVITVSATMESDDWIDWSNWGNDTADWTIHQSAPVTIAAPGVQILSTYNDGGTTTYSGTSMAAPHVSGAVALYLATTQHDNDGTAFDNARDALLTHAEPNSNLSNTSGHPHQEDFLNISGL